MAVTPPTHVSTQKSAEGTGDKTLEIVVNAGDLILLDVQSESANGQPDWEISVKAGLTWTSIATQNEAVEPNNEAGQKVLWALATETKTITVTVHQFAGSAMRWLAMAQVWRGHNGIGVVKAVDNALGEGTPEATLTQEFEHSALTAFVVDWKTTAGAVAWVGAEVQDQNFTYTGAFVSHIAHYPDEAATGSKTVKEETPATQRYRIVVVEVRGVESGTPSYHPHKMPMIA